MPDTYTSQHQLRSLDDVYNFRMKVYDLASMLTSEKIHASRISGGLSAYLRAIMRQDSSPFTLKTQIDLDEHRCSLHFTMPKKEGNSYEVHLAEFFDQLRHDATNELISASAHFNLQDRRANFDDLIVVINQKTNEELIREVEAKNAALQTSLENLARTSKEKNRMEEELNVAQNIQISMLPVNFADFAHRTDIGIFAHLIAAREVGGDFYDFFFLDENYFAVVIGDVSGKGVPAALMMAVCKTLIKARASTDRSTASILTHVNHEMAKENKNFMFVTVFMAILNTTTGELIYSNGGHNPAFIKRANSPVLDKLTDLHGPVLAAMEGLSYKESKAQLRKGDYLLCYTDGITEAHSDKAELFGDARLQDFLQKHIFESAEQTIHKLIDEVIEFENGADRFDDITALCLSYTNDLVDMDVQQKIINIANTIEEVGNAVVAFEEFAEFCDISMPVMMKVNIVLDELLSNIVKYGFDDEKEHTIRVTLELFGRKLVITFEDDGIPFNPFQKTPPDLTKPIEEREIGGLGIHLVRNLMDEFSYKRDVNRNIVTMVKYDVV